MTFNLLWSIGTVIESENLDTIWWQVGQTCCIHCLKGIAGALILINAVTPEKLQVVKDDVSLPTESNGYEEYFYAIFLPGGIGFLSKGNGCCQRHWLSDI